MILLYDLDGWMDGLLLLFYYNTTLDIERLLCYLIDTVRYKIGTGYIQYVLPTLLGWRKLGFLVFFRKKRMHAALCLRRLPPATVTR